MPFNGSGVYSAPASPGAFNPATSGGSADPTSWNTLRADIETALSTAICKDGQTTVTANLPMATFRHTGVGNAAARTDYAAAGQVQDGSLLYVLTTGTDTIVATLAPAITSYAVGQRFHLKKSAAANTGAVTLNANGVGAGPVVWPDGSALVASDLPASCMFDVEVQDISTPTAPVFHLQTAANFTGTGKIVKSASPTFTGSPLAPTQALADNSTKVATTAYVDRAAGVTPTSWTPSDQSGVGLIFSGVTANYVKIGNLIFAYFYLTFPATADVTAVSIGGLPVTIANNNYASLPAVLDLHGASAGSSAALFVRSVKNTTTFTVYASVGGGVIGNSSLSGVTISGLLIYPAA